MSTDNLASGWAKALGGDRKQFDMFFDRMLDGFAYHKIVVDKAGKPVDYVFLEVNSAFERMTHLKRESIIGKRVTDVLPGIEKDPADWIGVYGRVALTGEPAQFENYSEPLGQWFRVVAYCPSKGHFVTLLEDITERKKAESALSASEIKFRTVANFTYDWEYWIGPDGAVLFMSPSCERFTGYTPDEFTRNPELLNQIVHPEDRALFDEHYELVSSEMGHDIDFRIISRDGITHWIYHVCQPVFDDEGKWIGRRVSNREITKRKRAEEALRESEERLNRSQEIAHLGSWELDLKENRLTWSDEVYRIFGLKPQEFGATYEAFLAAIHPDDRTAVDAAYSGSLKEGKDGYEIEHRVVRKDNGETRFVHEKCTHIRDKSGQIVKSLGMVHDITERKKAEKEIASLAKFPAENPEPVLRIAKDGTLMYCNVAALKVIDQSKWKVNETVPESWRLMIDNAFNTGQKEEFEGQMGEKTFLFVVAPITYYVNVYGHDITERKKAEEELKRTRYVAQNRAEELERLQERLEEKASEVEEYANQMEALAEERLAKLKDAERLAAIGATAGMVGHDIRNPLQAIIGDVYLAKTELESYPEGDCKKNTLESLMEIEKNISYINKIVQDLQDYARPLNPVVVETNLQVLVEDLVNKGIPKKVKVRVKIPDEVAAMVTDPEIIRRVLTNLVSNAVQAMPDGGRLAISAAREADETVLVVRDTGRGIPEEYRHRLFTPLFTTKSRGQGFGLAVVKRMTDALGGAVTFESKIGKGTKFIVRLPARIDKR